MLKKLLTPFQFGMRSAIADAVLVGNAFVWYYIVLIILLQGIVPSQAALIWVLHFGGLILSAIAGTFISKKVEQRKLIIYWLLIGTLSSLAVIVINPSDISQVSIVALLLGVSLGFGMPTCISRYANSIPVENRGRVSGITLFASGIGILVFSVLGINSTLIVGAILGIWRLAGLIIFLSTSSPAYNLKQKKPDAQYSKIIRQHSFILYFIPWVMFSIINYLVAPVIPPSDSANVAMVQIGFIGLFALLGGFFIDSMGRKRIAIVGFILLGLGTALVGMSNGDPKILYLNAILNGTAFGLLLILFILTLWSDLSFSASSEKYYALGVTPFFISKFLELTIGASLLTNIENSQALFSFGAFFLFLAVLPLVYAPETLPEKAMKDRDIKSYIEKAQKIVQKKNGSDAKSKSQDKEALKQNEENDEKYAEALKLAEKYY